MMPYDHDEETDEMYVTYHTNRPVVDRSVATTAIVVAAFLFALSVLAQLI